MSEYIEEAKKIVESAALNHTLKDSIDKYRYNDIDPNCIKYLLLIRKQVAKEVCSDLCSDAEHQVYIQYINYINGQIMAALGIPSEALK